MDKIKLGIVGYGNLGRGVECAAMRNEDMEVTAIYTRREPKELQILTADAQVLPITALDTQALDDNRPDVLLLCGGSAEDLPRQSARYARDYHIVDSYDNHHQLAQHIRRVAQAAARGGKLAAVAIGWDPGLFSLNRAIAEMILPCGQNETFWGKGISQGHSNALRQVRGVRDGKQYTVPVPAAVAAARGERISQLSETEKHLRECYVVAEEGADLNRIEQEIMHMPGYFEGYHTMVHFISQEELALYHRENPHGGIVLRKGRTGVNNEHDALYEFKLKLGSNPEFTANVMVIYAGAVYRLAAEGAVGCRTILDIPVAYAFPGEREALLHTLL